MNNKISHYCFIFVIAPISILNSAPYCFETYPTASKLCLNRDNSRTTVISYKDSSLRFDDRYRKSNIYILDFTSSIYAFNVMTGFGKSELVIFKIIDDQIILIRSEPFTSAVQSKDFKTVISYETLVAGKCADGRVLITTIFKNEIAESTNSRCIRERFSPDFHHGITLESAFIEARNKCASRIISNNKAETELDPKKVSCAGSSYEWAQRSGLDPVFSE